MDYWAPLLLNISNTIQILPQKLEIIMYTKISMRFVNMNYQHCFPFLGINSCKIFIFLKEKNQLQKCCFFFFELMCLFIFQKCPFVPKIALLLPELHFYFPQLAFYFSELHFYSPKVPFCFLELFLFSKSALLFSSLAFWSSRSAFVFITVRVFFQECFFPQLIVTSPRPAQSCLKR